MVKEILLLLYDHIAVNCCTSTYPVSVTNLKRAGWSGSIAAIHEQKHAYHDIQIQIQ